MVGLGLAYVLDSMVEKSVRKGRLRVVLDDYAPIVPGFFLYFPSRSRGPSPLRLFVELVKERMGRPEVARKSKPSGR